MKRNSKKIRRKSYLGGVKHLLALVWLLLTIVLLLISIEPKEVKAEEIKIEVLPISEQQQLLEMDWSNFTSIYEEDLVLAKQEEARRLEKEISWSRSELSKRVTGMVPNVQNFTTTAYCSCEECCGKTDGITASMEKATQWYTLAAGEQYPLGTIIYVPALSDKPNQGWFIVQDRGGAISNDKLDVYFDTHTDAKQYGVKTLECYVFEF